MTDGNEGWLRELRFPGNLAQGLVVTVNTAYDILLSGVQVLHGLKEQRALQSSSACSSTGLAQVS